MFLLRVRREAAMSQTVLVANPGPGRGFTFRTSAAAPNRTSPDPPGRASISELQVFLASGASVTVGAAV